MRRRDSLVGCGMAMLVGKKLPLYPAQIRDGALSPTLEGSTRQWLDPCTRSKSILSLKPHGLSKREVMYKTADKTLHERR